MDRWQTYALTEVRTVHSRARTAIATLERLRDDEFTQDYYGKPDAEIDDMIFQLKQSMTHLEKWARKRRGKRAQ